MSSVWFQDFKKHLSLDHASEFSSAAAVKSHLDHFFARESNASTEAAVDKKEPQTQRRKQLLSHRTE
jgi:hypothetical protein